MKYLQEAIDNLVSLEDQAEQLNEKVAALRGINLPGEFSRHLAKKYNFYSTDKAELLHSTPTAKKVESGALLRVKDDGTAYLLYQQPKSWGQAKQWVAVSYVNDEIEAHKEPTFADIKSRFDMKGKGKYYFIPGRLGLRGRPEKESGDAKDVADRENVGYPERENIWKYMNKVFHQKIKDKLGKMSDEILSTIHEIPRDRDPQGRKANTSRQFLVRSRWNESARDEAIRFAEVIEELADDGFDSDAINRWLKSQKRLKKGRLEKYKDMDELERALHLEKNMPAKLAKSLVDTATEYYNRVNKMKAAIKKNQDKGE